MGVAHPKPQPVTIQKREWEFGKELAQTQTLKNGTLVSAKNAGAYTGCNACWREGHGHD